MRQIIFFTIAAATLASHGAHAASMYGRLEAGLQMSEASGVFTDLPLGGFLSPNPWPEWSKDSGFAGFAVVGGDLMHGLKIEAELGYAASDLSNQTSISELTGMVNALFDVQLAPEIDLVMGGGVGITSYSWDAFGPFVAGGTEKSDTGLAYQAIVGADIGLSEGLDLSLRYRYRASDVEMQGASIQFGDANALANVDGLDSHSLTVGLTFGF